MMMHAKTSSFGNTVVATPLTHGKFRSRIFTHSHAASHYVNQDDDNKTTKAESFASSNTRKSLLLSIFAAIGVIFVVHHLIEELKSTFPHLEHKQQPPSLFSWFFMSKSEQFSFSTFEAKPPVVGYDLEEASISKKKKQFTKNVLRIHPETMEVTHFDEPFSWHSTNLWNTANPYPHHVDLLGNQDWTNVDTSQYMSRPDTFEIRKPECDYPHDWAGKYYPTCNSLHEQGMMNQLIDPNRIAKNFLAGSGSMRDVWVLEYNMNINEPIESVVLKTLQLSHDFDDDNLGHHQQDALISEKLTGSPHVLDIYAACGASAVYEFASGGSLYDAIGAKEYKDEEEDLAAHGQFTEWTPQYKLHIAWQVVSAVHDLHYVDKNNSQPLVAHDDLDITQFVRIIPRDKYGRAMTKGLPTFKLSDFNGAELLKYGQVHHKVCPFSSNMKGGKTRSPEEYNDEDVTEKMDIYALGNVLYTLLIGKYPFHKDSISRVTNLITAGIRPPIPPDLKNTDNPILHVIVKAIYKCWKQDPSDRPTAKELKQMFAPLVTTT